MAGRDKMSYPDSNEIRQLTQKLKDQEDISLEEADRIYSLFSGERLYTTIDPNFAPTTYKSLQDWYKIVACKIEQGFRGNFIFTIVFSDIDSLNKLLLPAHQAIKEHGTFDDLCNVIRVDEKIYSALPFKHLFTKRLNDSTSKPYYKMTSFRAGMLYYPIEIDGKTYTAGGLLKHLFPVVTLGSPEDANHQLSREAFEVMVGAGRVVSRTLVLSQYEVKLFTLATFMRHKDFPCAAAVDAYNSKFIIFTGKDQAPVVKYALEVPFEELVQNAVKENVFDKKVAKMLLDNRRIPNFPIKKFLEASVRRIDDIIQEKLEWKAAQKSVENEKGWLEETR